MNFLLFLAPFSWGTQKREAAAPKASGCFMGGTCVVREEPGKQKPRSCRAQELARSRALSPLVSRMLRECGKQTPDAAMCSPSSQTLSKDTSTPPAALKVMPGATSTAAEIDFSGCS